MIEQLIELWTRATELAIAFGLRESPKDGLEILHGRNGLSALVNQQLDL